MEKIKRITGDSIHLMTVSNGGGGTRNYNHLNNKPTINNVTVEGEKTLSQYGLMTELAPALNDKVDKVSGKGLSTNDFTDAEKQKLAGIAAGAQVNVQSDWNATAGDAVILNKPTIPSKTSDLTNDSGFVNSTQAASAAPVQSVNGQTGNVTTPTYTAGAGISITNGVISVNYPDGDNIGYGGNE